MSTPLLLVLMLWLKLGSSLFIYLFDQVHELSDFVREVGYTVGELSFKMSNFRNSVNPFHLPT